MGKGQVRNGDHEEQVYQFVAKANEYEKELELENFILLVTSLV